MGQQQQSIASQPKLFFNLYNKDLKTPKLVSKLNPIITYVTPDHIELQIEPIPHWIQNTIKIDINMKLIEKQD